MNYLVEIKEEKNETTLALAKLQYQSIATWLNEKTSLDSGILILPSNILFRQVGAILAARYGQLLVSDCTELWAEDGTIYARKPSTDGKNFTKYIVSANYVILMRTMDGASEFLKENPFSLITMDCASVNEIAEAQGSSLEVISISENPSNKKDIKDAELIFSGGRGIMNEESFDALRELATRYDASVGASRPMVDQGWAAWEEQVGQTGSIVKPKVYVAFGISGAVQHITGIEKSQNIIAVNLNKTSPIFRYASYGAYSDDNSIIRNMLNIIDSK